MVVRGGGPSIQGDLVAGSRASPSGRARPPAWRSSRQICLDRSVYQIGGRHERRIHRCGKRGTRARKAARRSRAFGRVRVARDAGFAPVDTGARLFAECSLEPLLDEAPLRPIDRRRPDIEVQVERSSCLDCARRRHSLNPAWTSSCGWGVAGGSKRIRGTSRAGKLRCLEHEGPRKRSTAPETPDRPRRRSD